VEQVIIGLAHGLSSLEGDEQYLFMCYEGQTDWLEPFAFGPCSIVSYAPPLKNRLVRKLPALAALRRRMKSSLAGDPGPAPVPSSDGTAERLGADVIHFPREGFLTSIPSIYHPHDLQHVHLPEFFSETERRQRDLWYRAFADQAAVVSVTSEWGKRDLVQHLGVPPKKIAVVPLAPALAAYGEPLTETQRDSVLAAKGIVRPYALYPAQTWPHKNHVRLIHAIKKLCDRGLDVDLVCTGTLNESFPRIQEAVAKSKLQDRIHFLGYVTVGELQALYAGARCLVMPTLFEAAGGFGPIAEAFLAGVPVACSNVTSLPEQVGDAALLFDPLDEDAIASALGTLWSDGDLRATLAQRGRANISRFSWELVARTFRAHYRRLAGRQLGAEDAALLDRKAEF
jgi:glycosyltransferase involved in cell wall biosynthesis